MILLKSYYFATRVIGITTNSLQKYFTNKGKFYKYKCICMGGELSTAIHRVPSCPCGELSDGEWLCTRVIIIPPKMISSNNMDLQIASKIVIVEAALNMLPGADGQYTNL